MRRLKSTQGKYHWATLSAEQWRDRAIAWLIIILVTLAVPEINRFVNLASLLFAFFLTMIVADILERFYKLPFSVTLLSLGIPMGIVSSSVGLVQMFIAHDADSATVKTISSGTGIMLLTTFYGLILCVIGFSLYKDNQNKISTLPINLKSLLFLVFFVFGSTYISMVTGRFNGYDYLSLKPLLLCLGLLVLFHLARAKQKGIAENIADASIATTITSIMIALIMLYSSFGSDPNFKTMGVNQFLDLANYANYGLLYGGSLYIFSFLLSLYTNEFHKINFKMRNWHLVEAFSFYVFMTLAAPSLFELV